MTPPLIEGRVIWKFLVKPWVTAMDMPQGARVLHAHEQGEDLYLWAEVDPQAPTVMRKVLAIPTGGRAASDLTYIGTAHLDYGDGDELVFHVYDGGEV